VASQEFTQGGVDRQLMQQINPGLFHVRGPFRESVGGLRTDGLGALAGDGGY
jgi:hypothetical protein